MAITRRSPECRQAAGQGHLIMHIHGQSSVTRTLFMFSKQGPLSSRNDQQATVRMCIAAAVGVVVLSLPSYGWAHVKWFAPYDVTKAPTPVGGVLTPHFLFAFTCFTVMVFAGFMFDRLVTVRWRRQPRTRDTGEVEQKLMRAGIGGFFIALFAAGGMILTPELKTQADWPAWMQLGIAISLMSTRTCIIGAAGIIILYGYAVALYGTFHTSDYPMFLGIAAYLVLIPYASKRLISLRITILFVAVCVSLMWGAIEKWSYPQWTFPLLTDRPYLTFGFSYDDVMIVAGFVEFALAFYILTGLAFVRLAILVLLSIFLAAIVDFGKTDAIGHLPIMVPLFIMLLHGPTRLHHWFHEASDTVIGSARKASVAFATSICLFFAIYYGLQHAEYGPVSKQNPIAALAAAPHDH